MAELWKNWNPRAATEPEPGDPGPSATGGAPPEDTPASLSPSTAAFLEAVPEFKEDVPHVWEFPLNDDGRAAFVAAHLGDILRWVPELKEWRVWHGHRWHADHTGRAGHYLQLLSRHEQCAAAALLRDLTGGLRTEILEAPRDGEKTPRPNLSDKEIRRRYDAATRAALALGDERIIAPTLAALARQRNMVIPVVRWDASPRLVGTLNGMLDLMTGTPHPGRPSAYITKELDVASASGADCPEWRKFIARILPDALARYVQQLAGYSLTGRRDDQAFYFCYGAGKNGKSIFINTLAGIFGDYAGKAAPELLEEPRNGVPPKANIAQLPGIRFLHGDETSEGARLRESLIKGLTGGDELTGEQKYCAPFRFSPVAKLWLMGNHKPRVHGTDNGIWRRVRLIPFTATITPEEEIPESVLRARFHAERPGILNWMLEGLRMGPEAGGIPMPAAVKAATQDYRESEDDLADFIADCTQDAEDHYREPKHEVFQAYQKWARENGITFPLSGKQFTRRLGERPGWILDAGKRHWQAKSVVGAYQS